MNTVPVDAIKRTRRLSATRYAYTRIIIEFVVIFNMASIAQRDELCNIKQESRAIARKLRDAVAVRFGLKFADIHYKFKSSQAPKARLQNSRHTGAKQNLT